MTAAQRWMIGLALPVVLIGIPSMVSTAIDGRETRVLVSAMKDYVKQLNERVGRLELIVQRHIEQHNGGSD